MIDSNLSYKIPPVPTPKKNNMLIIILLVVILVVGGSIFIYSRSKKSKSIEKEVVPTLQEEATPTEKAPIDKKIVKIQVLNGTGTPGQAGEVAKILEKEGYEADNITTGNVDQFGQEITSIKAKSGLEELTGRIKEALREKFDNVEIESTELEEKSEYDIVIVTGGKKYQEPTNTPSPSLTPSTEKITPTSTSTPSATPTSTP